ncbi:hypothetical protein QL285_029827 [Trifolium repens]|jgi:hypothetical protein|nr:hypothetical protein QL285_029827 [Trifolium repens]
MKDCEINVEELAAISLRAMENLPPIDQLQCPNLKTLLIHSTEESTLQITKCIFWKYANAGSLGDYKILLHMAQSVYIALLEFIIVCLSHTTIDRETNYATDSLSKRI